MRSDTSYTEPTGIKFGTNWNKVRYVPIGCRSSVTTKATEVVLVVELVAEIEIRH